MSKVRSAAIALVFLVGCAVGGAAGRLVVPPANAQPVAAAAAPGTPRWEYYCTATAGADDAEETANNAGQDGWELVGAATSHRMSANELPVWCFKRPL